MQEGLLRGEADGAAGSWDGGAAVRVGGLCHELLMLRHMVGMHLSTLRQTQERLLEQHQQDLSALPPQARRRKRTAGSGEAAAQAGGGGGGRGLEEGARELRHGNEAAESGCTVEAQGRGRAFRLKVPHDEAVARFLDTCRRRAHEQSSAVCAHAPSASRLRSVLLPKPRPRNLGPGTLNDETQNADVAATIGCQASDWRCVQGRSREGGIL